MRSLVLAVLLALTTTSAMAETTCRYGKSGVFDFVNWSFKKVDSEWMEMTITYRNKLDVPLSWYEIHIEVGDHDFGFKSDVPVLAGGEATSKPQLGMPQEDADMFAPLTPMLCAIGVTDDKGKHTSYY